MEEEPAASNTTYQQDQASLVMEMQDKDQPLSINSSFKQLIFQ